MFARNILGAAPSLGRSRPLFFSQTPCSAYLTQPTRFKLFPHLLQTWKSTPHRPFHTSPRWQQYQRFNRQQQRRLPIANLLYRWSQRPTFLYEVGGVGVAAGGAYWINLDTVAVSGRRRFNVVSDSYMEQLGTQQAAEILQQYGRQILPDSDPRTIMVQRVLRRLLPSSGLPDSGGWEVHVIDSEEANAFVLPG